MAEPIVAGPVAVVALHFNVTALSAGTVVMEHARIDEPTRFTAGVEGFNSRHSASQCLGVVVRKAVHVMRGSFFSSQPSKSQRLDRMELRPPTQSMAKIGASLFQIVLSTRRPGLATEPFRENSLPAARRRALHGCLQFFAAVEHRPDASRASHCSHGVAILRWVFCMTRCART